MTKKHPPLKKPDAPNRAAPAAPDPNENAAKPRETGGPKGLEPTRYGDWERKGIAVDF